MTRALGHANLASGTYILETLYADRSRRYDREPFLAVLILPVLSFTVSVLPLA